MSPALHSGGECNSSDPDRSIVATTLITIAGSAGAFEGLRLILDGLPSRLGAAVAAVLHTGTRSRLAEVLAITSRLSVREASSGDLLRERCVYVAPAGTHLVVNPDGRLSVSATDLVRRFCPSADWLFESAAASYRDRHIAVILSGMLSDGADQLRAVKRLGGTVLVQSPTETRFGNMPRAAVATGFVDRVLTIHEMVAALCDAVEQCRRDGDVSSWEAPFGPSLSARSGISNPFN